MQDVSVDKLGLSVRACNCLKRKGIFFLSQLINLKREEMSQVRNMGAKSIQEVLDLQKKISEDLEINMLDLEIATYKVDLRNVDSVLMLHKAFPQLLGKKVISITFHDEKGGCYPDIKISELELSLRTKNCLMRNGIFNILEVTNMAYDIVKEFSNMGAKSINELIEYLRKNVDYVIEGQQTDVFVNETFECIQKELLKEFSDFQIDLFEKSIKINIFEQKANITYKSLDELEEVVSKPEILKQLLYTASVEKNLEQYIWSLIRSHGGMIGVSVIEEKIPSVFIELGIYCKVMSTLLKNGKLEKYEDAYRKWLPNIDDWIDNLKDNIRIAVTLRLEGKTLEECGKEMGITRERVRQLVLKAVKEKPVLREDDYMYWYSKYLLDFEAMHMIFGLNQKVYNYLAMLDKPGCENVEDMLQDSNITGRIYVNLKNYINRDSILISENYVPCKRELLCRELAKANCLDTDMTFDYFYELYMNLLKANRRDEDRKLLFPSERAFEARMQDSQYLLMKYGRRFRYYPINEYDVVELIEKLHLEQFQNIEISTLKLFRDYPEVMDEFNILDEYELHNLLKKTENVWNPEKYNVVLTRMPFMAFGQINRAKQTEELLFQIAPVTMEEFCEFYEMEYGVLARTVQANMTPYITKYYHGGLYQINQPLLEPEEERFLTERLNDDFYFIEDIKKVFVSRFGEEKENHINPRTLKELGFRVYANYIIRNVYQSADEYFTKYFTKNALIDLGSMDTRYVYLQSAYGTLTSLCFRYELLEYEDKKYIRYNHFVSVVKHLSKDDLMRYVEEAIKFAGNEKFFSVCSLKKKGFDSELHNLGFSDWFNGALIQHSKKIRFIKVGGGILFYQGSSQCTSVDFLRHLMRDFRKVDIEDFICYIKQLYGVSFTREKITGLIKNSEMYFDSTMEKIYLTKEDYYEDF